MNASAPPPPSSSATGEDARSPTSARLEELRRIRAQSTSPTPKMLVTLAFVALGVAAAFAISFLFLFAVGNTSLLENLRHFQVWVLFMNFFDERGHFLHRYTLCEENNLQMDRCRHILVDSQKSIVFGNRIQFA